MKTFLFTILLFLQWNPFVLGQSQIQLLNNHPKSYHYLGELKTSSTSNQDTLISQLEFWCIKDSSLYNGEMLHIKITNPPEVLTNFSKVPFIEVWQLDSQAFWKTSASKKTLQSDLFTRGTNFIDHTILEYLFLPGLHSPIDSSYQTNENAENVTYEKNQGFNSGEIETRLVLNKNSEPVSLNRTYSLSDYRNYFDLRITQFETDSSKIVQHFKSLNTRKESILPFQTSPLIVLENSIQKGATVPPIKGYSLSGEHFTLPYGKEDDLLLIDFWFLGCPPCSRRIPTVSRMIKTKYPNIRYITINANEQGNEVSLIPWSLKSKLDPSQVYFLDEEFIVSYFGIKGYPASVFIKNNKVVFSSRGESLGSEVKYFRWLNAIIASYYYP
jgi:thiol-disulfide isomerase/thioredoxin